MQIALAVLVLAVLGSVAWVTMNGPAKVVADAGMALLAHAYAIRRYSMERREVLVMLKEKHGENFEIKEEQNARVSI